MLSVIIRLKAAEKYFPVVVWCEQGGSFKSAVLSLKSKLSFETRRVLRNSYLAK